MFSNAIVSAAILALSSMAKAQNDTEGAAPGIPGLSLTAQLQLADG